MSENDEILVAETAHLKSNENVKLQAYRDLKGLAALALWVSPPLAVAVTAFGLSVWAEFPKAESVGAFWLAFFIAGIAYIGGLICFKDG